MPRGSLLYLLFIFVFPAAGRSADQLSVARCRSHCITELRRGPSVGGRLSNLLLNDAVCEHAMECNICWDICFNLGDDWDKWSPVCFQEELDFCPAHPGCGHACRIMSSMRPVAQRARGPAQPALAPPRLRYRRPTREMEMAWTPPAQARGEDTAVAWVFFQEAGGPWRPLLQTLNTTIRVQVSAPAHSYSFCVLLVDRHGVATQSPVVRLGPDLLLRVTEAAFQIPVDLDLAHVARDPAHNEWRILRSHLDAISRRLGHQSNLTQLVRRRLPLLGATGAPPLLAAALAAVGAVAVILVAVTCYFQRSQSKQLAALRASFHAWSGRLGSSFRSSLHVARQSFRRRSARTAQCVATAESGDILTGEPASPPGALQV